MINVHIIVFATIITQHPTQEPPTSTNGIYWFHIRKSGGTTVGNWLRKVAKSKNMSFSRTEGDVLNKTKESDVWVTTIRDPVDRIWSQYLYDGKWESPNWDRPPKYNFSQFLHKNDATHCPDRRWVCSQNCFVFWFGGCHHGHIIAPFAAKNLGLFDVVINIHRMNDPEYVKSVQKCLNTTIPVTRRHSWGNDYAIKATKVYPEKRPTLDKLWYANILDYVLLAPYWHIMPC